MLPRLAFIFRFSPRQQIEMFSVYIDSGNSIILTALFLLQALNYERYGEFLSLSASPLHPPPHFHVFYSLSIDREMANLFEKVFFSPLHAE
jgi:hypothetical protein